MKKEKSKRWLDREFVKIIIRSEPYTTMFNGLLICFTSAQKKVAVYYYIQRKSLTEIALLLNKSESTISRQLTAIDKFILPVFGSVRELLTKPRQKGDDDIYGGTDADEGIS